MDQASQDASQDQPWLEASHKAAEKFSNSLTGSCRAVPTSELLQDTEKLNGKVILVTGQFSSLDSDTC